MLRPDPQTIRWNRLITRELSRQRPWHTLTPVELRAVLALGVMGPPPGRLDAVAQDRTVPGPHGAVPLRVFVPEEVTGVYLHIHGGGFVTGSHDGQDEILWARAQAAKVAVVSVGYRLSPEYRWPIPNDDCETAAAWLVQHARAEFGSDRLAIGGESAGAHLAVATLVRLRDKHGYRGFRGATLTYGVFDLRGTPSATAWGDRPLVLSTPLVRWYADQYAPPEHRTDPDVSPLFADLKGLPPALFTVGTEDPLLDDTLFMAARWRAAGNETVLKVHAGAPHSFDTMPIPVGQEASASITHFVAQAMGDGS